MGYTPVFDSLTKGTLCGRWPDIGLWPIVLSLADKNGIVDATPAYIASVTGLPLAEVTACLARFCQPDPGSRSQALDGARMRLLDAHRDWGWQIVNFHFYREKARKAAYDAERVASGANAERMRTRADPRGPAQSRAHPLSDSDSDSDSKSKRERARAARPAPRKRCPEDFRVTEELRAWASQQAPDVDLDRETESFRDWEFKTAKVDWPATWRTWMRKAQVDAKPKGPKQVAGMTSEAAAAFEALVRSDGAVRPPRVAKALEAVGGWQRIRMRTPVDEHYIRRDFERAHSEAA